MPMDIHGYPWISMIQMAIHEYTWVSMEIHGYPWSPWIKRYGLASGRQDLAVILKRLVGMLKAVVFWT